MKDLQQLTFIDYNPKWLNIELEEIFTIVKKLYPKCEFVIKQSSLGYSEIILEKKKVKFDLHIGRDAELGIWKNNVLIYFGVNTNTKGCGCAVNNFEDFYECLKRFMDKYFEYLAEK